MSMKRRLYRVNTDKRTRISNQLADELAAEPEAVFAFLYGSFVESEMFHDVDVGVYLKGVTPDRATVTALGLAQRLSTRVGLPVDVRILNMASISFLYHALRGQLVLCRDEAVLTELMESAARRYLDIAPLLRHSAKEAFAT